MVSVIAQPLKKTNAVCLSLDRAAALAKDCQRGFVIAYPDRETSPTELHARPETDDHSRRPGIPVFHRRAYRAAAPGGRRRRHPDAAPCPSAASRTVPAQSFARSDA